MLAALSYEVEVEDRGDVEAYVVLALGPDRAKRKALARYRASHDCIHPVITYAAPYALV